MPYPGQLGNPSASSPMALHHLFSIIPLHVLPLDVYINHPPLLSSTSLFLLSSSQQTIHSLKTRLKKLTTLTSKHKLPEDLPVFQYPPPRCTSRPSSSPPSRLSPSPTLSPLLPSASPPPTLVPRTANPVFLAGRSAIPRVSGR